MDRIQKLEIRNKIVRRWKKFTDLKVEIDLESWNRKTKRISSCFERKEEAKFLPHSRRGSREKKNPENGEAKQWMLNNNWNLMLKRGGGPWKFVHFPTTKVSDSDCIKTAPLKRCHLVCFGVLLYLKIRVGLWLYLLWTPFVCLFIFNIKLGVTISLLLNVTSFILQQFHII